MLSEGRGYDVSSKRVMGVIGFLFTMFCIAWDIIKCEGRCISGASEDLLQTLLIMCAALLGINSVTSIFKDKQKKNEGDGENVG